MSNSKIELKEGWVKLYYKNNKIIKDINVARIYILLISFFCNPCVIPANIGISAKGSIATKIRTKLFKNVLLNVSTI